MRKLALICSLFIFTTTAYAFPIVYAEKGLFGLKENNKIITPAKYSKLIKLGDTGWLIQYKNKFGIMHKDGRILVQPKYSYAERVIGKFVKLKKGTKFALFDEDGFEILPLEYSSIDILYGGMFLTCKNYKYGVTDFNGQVILENVFDDIYMPERNKIILVYQGETFEIKTVKRGELSLPDDIVNIDSNKDFYITKIIEKPVSTTGYYSISATNYFLKLFSSISPAYEDTIDDLMLSKGADAANVIIKFTWIPAFPFVYAKNYYQNFKAPNNGPLKEVKSKLKKELIN